MIAIAGSKGGCGKSTVTLGLAKAFSRTETPAVAIDADRQLPNLHVMADVGREPTVARPSQLHYTLRHENKTYLVQKKRSLY